MGYWRNKVKKLPVSAVNCREVPSVRESLRVLSGTEFRVERRFGKVSGGAIYILNESCGSVYEKLKGRHCSSLRGWGKRIMCHVFAEVKNA